MSFVVVEHDFKEPGELSEIGLDQQRRRVAVTDALEIPAGRAADIAAIALVRLCEVDAGRIFGSIVVEDGVAFVVLALANEPAENTLRILRIGNTALDAIAVERGDVVLGD